MVSPLPAQQPDAEKREIRIARGTSLCDFLEEVAREEHAVILCTEAQYALFAKTLFEVDVNQTVAKERYVDACRSILHAGGRVLAARLLGCLGPADKATLGALRKATRDEDPHVRSAAAHAIGAASR